MTTCRVLAPRPQSAIDAAPFHQWVLPDETPWTRFYRLGADYLLRFPDLADFEVTADGQKIHCWPSLGVSEETIQHLYLNQVLPLALSKQGKLLFHASAVEVAGRAVAFVGQSGMGKSTLAASFASNGFPFLADDGLQVVQGEDGFLVQPNHPSIRLWDDSQEALIGQDTPLAPPVQYTVKARLLAGDTIPFCDQARRLGRVYFLGQGKAQWTIFQPMSASEALIELVKHSFLLDIEEQEMLAYHFAKLAKLVEASSYYRLDYPRRFDVLPAVRQAILRHAIQ